jgi:hypothetical protein
MFARRACASLLIVVLAVLLDGCGGVVFFIGTGPNQTTLIVSGTCTSVQLVNIVGTDGVLVTATSVTLFDRGTSRTFQFCGDVGSQFPINSFVTVHYTNASSCLVPTVVLPG